MFTGIVSERAAVTAVHDRSFGLALEIQSPPWDRPPRPGESIAVDGCCLTLATPSDGRVADHLCFDVIQQTLRTTALGRLKVGSVVNLERAVTAETLLSGHIVQGHIDGVGTIAEVVDRPDERRLRIVPPAALLDYIVEKGSIAVNGVSLTIASHGPDCFEVALIPTTLEVTNLDRVEVGSPVNLEADYLVKTVVHWMRRHSGAGAIRAPQ